MVEGCRIYRKTLHEKEKEKSDDKRKRMRLRSRQQRVRMLLIHNNSAFILCEYSDRPLIDAKKW